MDEALSISTNQILSALQRDSVLLGTECKRKSLLADWVQFIFLCFYLPRHLYALRYMQCWQNIIQFMLKEPDSCVRHRWTAIRRLCIWTNINICAHVLWMEWKLLKNKSEQRISKISPADRGKKNTHKIFWIPGWRNIIDYFIWIHMICICR